MTEGQEPKMKSEGLKPGPGVCIPWAEKLKELPEISGDKQLIQSVWEYNEALAYVYIWQCLLSF